MKKTVSVLLAILLLTFSAAALGEKLSIAATPVPHAVVLEFIKPLLAEKGFELEIVVFEDYVLPNNVVENGEIDANYFQHTNYLNDFNENNNTHLVPVVPVHYEPMGVFKSRIADLADLPDGATIGVPNDTSNEARALLLLQEMGLIEIDPDAGVTATKLDITKNDKNLTIVEMEAAQLPHMLADFDLAVINGNYALSSGLSLLTDTVGAESAASEGYAGLVNYIVVREGNEDAPFVQALREVFNDQRTIDFITETYQGSVVLALDAGLE